MTCDDCLSSCRVTGYPEFWERAEAEKQPQILPSRCASRQDDSAWRWVGTIASLQFRGCFDEAKQVERTASGTEARRIFRRIRHPLTSLWAGCWSCGAIQTGERPSAAKADRSCGGYGTAEAVPLQNSVLPRYAAAMNGSGVPGKLLSLFCPDTRSGTSSIAG